MKKIILIKTTLLTALIFCFTDIYSQGLPACPQAESCPANHMECKDHKGPKDQNNPKFQNNHQNHLEQIHSRKVAFFTQYLDLSPSEAEKFWPVYNKYWKDKMALNKTARVSLKKLMTSLNSEEKISDSEIKTATEKYYNLLEQEIKLTKDMIKDISVFLPISKTAKLIYAEDIFREQLIRELKGRKDHIK